MKVQSILFLAMLLAHGSAWAQPATLPLDLADRPSAAALTIAQANAFRAAGVARTSFDHRFERKDTVASFGFLCGLHPNLDTSGGANAYDNDPHGRFLGAKFSRAF